MLNHGRLACYGLINSSARSVGEYFDLHPGTPGTLRRDLGNKLWKKHYSTPRFTPRFLKTAGLGPVGVAHALLTAASSIVGPWTPLPAADSAVEAAAGDATESALLTRFAEYERTEADTHQEPLEGSLTSLASAMPGRDGDGLRL